MPDEIVTEKIRRARRSGPPSVTKEATIAEMDAQPKRTILHKGTNEWVCFPGNENIMGDVPMSLDPMGIERYMDLRTRKAKPCGSPRDGNEYRSGDRAVSTMSYARS